MQLIEICLIGMGTLLLALAFYLGKKHGGRDEPGAREQVVEGLSPEKAVRLQTSLMRLLQELQTLSSDMTTDLEEKLSELKELLQLADTTHEEKSADTPEKEPSAEMKTEKQKETSETAADEATSPPLSHRYSEIFKMAEEGLAIDEIARRMQMGKGEIQLILSLRQKD